MREPSGHGSRGHLGRGCLLALLLALFSAGPAGAQAITRFVRDTGHINFVTTGGSLRTQDNNGNPCLVGATSTQTLSGIPAGTTIRNAYLYWGGSGGSADTSVTLNGSGVTATRTFAATYTGVTPNLPYFGGFANVTALVTGNGSYTFGGLGVVTGSPHCDVSAVVSGWSLVVIYEAPSERLRAINLYDGLASFRGSQVVLTPDGFRVPPANFDGRMAVFTLEGDPANSTAQNGFSEALRYNGSMLDDGINVAGSDPPVQQFDGTINTQGVATSYGIDVDQYDISAFLAPGQTSGTTTFSAGADLVLLMAQVVSATSEPAVNLGVTKTHSGTFVSGVPGVYTITVSNAAGAEREDNTVTVTDTLPAGLTFSSGTGTGWTCGAVGQVVTCTHPPMLNPGASFPPITLTVNVLQSAAASVTNTVTVSTTSYELPADTANNSATDLTATLDPNISTSTKSVVDLNGGEVAPGDTLRYTITLTESAGGQAVNVSLTDSIPDNTTFAGVVSIPAGAASVFTPPPAGANSNGLITVTGITVPASGSVTVVFDVAVIAGTAAGETVNNTATLNNPNGAENNPAAPPLIVTPSLLPSAGTKFLYLRRNGAGTRSLSRNRPSGVDTNESVAAGGNDTFVISPVLRGPLTVPVGDIPVRLWLSRNGGTGARNVTVTLTSSSGGLNATQTVSVNPNNSLTTPTLSTFTLNNGTLRNIPTGATITLTIANSGSNAFLVWPNGDGLLTGTVPNNSRVELNSTFVINVDWVRTYSAAYNDPTLLGTFYPGNNVFVRAQISDPFGSFDITSARMIITDPNNVERANTLMTEQGAVTGCGLTTTATCIFETQFVVPASPALGTWNVSVTGFEGIEQTVTDLGLGSFVVVIPQPALTILKTSTVLSDPVNNTTNPKRIPQAVVRYDVTVTNSGPGTVDSGTLVITDPIPADASMYVSTALGNPVVFADGAPPSGLSFNYATHVTYSSVGVAGPFTYTPMPDGNGFDAAVRAVRIAPAGVMNNGLSGNRAFTLQFRVRIN